jgi:tetratricopeptide (TPR) repeat protein
LGVIEGLLGNKEMELQYYYKALQQKPDSMDLMNNIAALYIEKKEYTKAEKLLTRILTAEPNFAEAKRNFAILKSRMKIQDNN